jgi:hypothetical protein
MRSDAQSELKKTEHFGLFHYAYNTPYVASITASMINTLDFNLTSLTF